MLALVILILIINFVQTSFLVAACRLLVRMQESDQARVRRFLEARGLIDIPTTADYADAREIDRRSGDLQYVRDN